MKKVEVESFFKSFILFFISLGLLISYLFYSNYLKELQSLENELFSKMRVCSYNLKCDEFEINFIEKKDQNYYELYKNNNTLFSFYPINDSQNFIMQISVKKDNYLQLTGDLQDDIVMQYIVVMFVVFALSIIFSLYAIYPLRSALFLTQEFIKDILHDFNTPISSIRLNTSMLKKNDMNIGKIQRIEASVQNILDLQENLKTYLNEHQLQKQDVNIYELVLKRVELLEKNYQSLKFQNGVDANIYVKTNKEALTRILDNLLINAAKYNKKSGYVNITYDDALRTLRIKDSGIGIKNPKKIYDRFYKENNRGTGIGLHIVKKLCDELKIKIEVKSQINIGTEFALTFN